MMTPRAVLTLVPALALGLGACINDDVYLYETELRGTVVTGDPLDAGAELHVEIHHASLGVGQLEHPLGLIETTSFALDGDPSWQHTLLVPTEDAEGLVVYAWLDLDGDGILCADGPSGAPEPVGLIELEQFPAHEISFDITLDEACLGPERLFP